MKNLIPTTLAIVTLAILAGTVSAGTKSSDAYFVKVDRDTTTQNSTDDGSNDVIFGGFGEEYLDPEVMYAIDSYEDDTEEAEAARKHTDLTILKKVDKASGSY